MLDGPVVIRTPDGEHTLDRGDLVRFPAGPAGAHKIMYFKLRAKWVKEDPPRNDHDVVTEFRPTPLDLMSVLPAGPIPPGAATVWLLHAAGASIEATVLSVERAMGASIARRETGDVVAVNAELARLREAQEHATRSAALTIGLREAARAVGPMLQQQFTQYPKHRVPT